MAEMPRSVSAMWPAESISTFSGCLLLNRVDHQKGSGV